MQIKNLKILFLIEYPKYCVNCCESSFRMSIKDQKLSEAKSLRRMFIASMRAFDG
jgi:hypothetical protein